MFPGDWILALVVLIPVGWLLYRIKIQNDEIFSKQAQVLQQKKRQQEKIVELLRDILAEVTELRALQKEASKTQADETLIKSPSPTYVFPRTRTRENDDID